jgi:hypothetical protein
MTEHLNVEKKGEKKGGKTKKENKGGKWGRGQRDSNLHYLWIKCQ